MGFDDMVYVLARSKGVSHDRTLWLRSRIWWGLDDRNRVHSDGSPMQNVPKWPVAVERANMEMILGMLQEGKIQPQSLIQQGELLRLLGRSGDAVAVLESVQTDGHSQVRAVKIERLARSGDTQVRMLTPSTW